MKRIRAVHLPVEDLVPGDNIGDRVFSERLWSEATPAKAPAASFLSGFAGGGTGPNAYTFALIDSQNLISSSLEAEITRCATYVIGLIGRYIDWKGTLDFVVEIKPASESPYPSIDGILPSVTEISWDGSGWVNQTLAECVTGTDGDLARPDAGCTIYLGADGTIKNYGAPVWLDPDPRFGVGPDVPAGANDFVGIYTHEIFHSLGFYAVTKEWAAHSVTESDISYFTGASADALYGGRIPFVHGSDHYGYTADPGIPITRGLMFQWGNYDHNRLDIGRIDLAVLADLGHTIKTYDGLPLFELIDTALNLSGTNRNDFLYGDYHANALDGGAGSDTLDAGAGADRLTGGGGHDRLAGGAGSDIFAFTSVGDSLLYAARSDGVKYMPDQIADFTAGADKIDLSAIDAVAGTPANDAFTFIGASVFSGHAGELRVEVAGGRADIFADVNGDGFADVHIVAITASIGAGDFVL